MLVAVMTRPGSLALQGAEVPSDLFRNDGITLLAFKNASGASVKARLTAKRKCEQGVLHIEDVSIAAGTDMTLAGPFPRLFNDGMGDARVDWLTNAGAPLGSAAGLSIGAISFAPALVPPLSGSPTGILALQTTSPTDIPVLALGGAVTH